MIARCPAAWRQVKVSIGPTSLFLVRKDGMLIFASSEQLLKDMREVKEQYKDPNQLQLEMMKLYKQHDVHPLG